MSTEASKKALDESIKQLEEGRGIKVKLEQIDLNSEKFKDKLIISYDRYPHHQRQ